MTFRKTRIQIASIASLLISALPLTGNAQEVIKSTTLIEFEKESLLNNKLSISIEEPEPIEPSNFVERDLSIFSADEIYGEWNSIFLTPTSIPSSRLPNKFNINLAGFIVPHYGKITSGFGVRTKTRNHYGVDINTNFGDPIKAAYDGKVRIAGYNKNGYGYYVIIRHPNGLETIYAHLSRPLVKKNDEVKVGQIIGKSGKTGRMTGSVLHFEIRFLGTPFDPQRFFDFNDNRLLAETFIYEKKHHNPIPRVRKQSAKRM